jgi:DNA repair protein RadC
MTGMGPDLLYVDSTEELIRESTAMAANPGRGGRPRQSRRMEQFEYAPYAGWERVLFRTAVVRSADWRPTDVGPRVERSSDLLPLCRHLMVLDHERLVIFCLDAKDRVTAIHEASVGGLHGTAALPADIGRVPVLLDAAGAIIVHNHPSGDPQPSPDDIRMTLATADMFQALDIRFLDHMIVAGRQLGAEDLPHYYSMAAEAVGPWAPGR